MAYLQRCVSCDGEVSDEAKVCPNCGQPKPSYSGWRSRYHDDSSKPSPPSEPYHLSTKECIQVFCFLGVIIAIIINFFSCIKTSPSTNRFMGEELMEQIIKNFINSIYYGCLIVAGIGLLIGLLKKNKSRY
jgi:ABC-type Fe3+ transport system permease subunit